MKRDLETGARVRAAVAYAGADVTVAKLAQALSISPSTFARITAGDRRLGLAEAATIARMTGVPLRFLLEGWAIYEDAPLTGERRQSVEVDHRAR